MCLGSATQIAREVWRAQSRGWGRAGGGGLDVRFGDGEVDAQGAEYVAAGGLLQRSECLRPDERAIFAVSVFSGSHGWQWARELSLNDSSVWTYDLGENR